MMQQEAIVHTMMIDRIGQRVLFQVRLPRDARRVIGLEYAVRKIEGIPLEDTSLSGIIMRLINEEPAPGQDLSYGCVANKSIGRLSLRNSDCENVFYEGDLVENRNTGQYEAIAAKQYLPCEWMQSTKREEITLNVRGGLIEGSFQDSFGLNEYSWLRYELNLYLWIEKCMA